MHFSKLKMTVDPHIILMVETRGSDVPLSELPTDLKDFF